MIRSPGPLLLAGPLARLNLKISSKFVLNTLCIVVSFQIKGGWSQVADLHMPPPQADFKIQGLPGDQGVFLPKQRQ